MVSDCLPSAHVSGAFERASPVSNPWGGDRGTAREMLASFSRTFRDDGAAGAAAADAGSADESSLSAQLSQMGLGLSDSSASSGRPFDPLQPYGLLPSSLTQQVSCPTSTTIFDLPCSTAFCSVSQVSCACSYWGCRQLSSAGHPASAQVLMASEPDLAAGLPDELPGQSNCDKTALSYSDAATYYAAAAGLGPASLFGSVWSGSNPAVSGLSLTPLRPQSAALQAALSTPRPAADASAVPHLDWAAPSPSRLASLRPAGSKPVLNEVVCGTLMLAYERAGLWEQVGHHLTSTLALSLNSNPHPHPNANLTLATTQPCKGWGHPNPNPNIPLTLTRLPVHFFMKLTAAAAPATRLPRR